MAQPPGTYYRNCEMKHLDGRVETHWIPEEYALVNAHVQLNRGTQVWESGWQVVTIGDRALYENVPEPDHSYQVQWDPPRT